MCDFAVGLTHCYKTTVFLHFNNITYMFNVYSMRHESLMQCMVLSRRAPAMVWYRLKYELTSDGWLTNRQCDSVSVTQWTHSQLASAVEQRYLSNDSTRRQLNNLLATYWLGMSGSDQQNHQSNMNLCGSNSNGRSSIPVIYDADQPLMFDCELAPGKPR